MCRPVDTTYHLGFKGHPRWQLYDTWGCRTLYCSNERLSSNGGGMSSNVYHRGSFNSCRVGKMLKDIAVWTWTPCPSYYRGLWLVFVVGTSRIISNDTYNLWQHFLPNANTDKRNVVTTIQTSSPICPSWSTIDILMASKKLETNGKKQRRGNIEWERITLGISYL